MLDVYFRTIVPDCQGGNFTLIHTVMVHIAQTYTASRRYLVSCRRIVRCTVTAESQFCFFGVSINHAVTGAGQDIVGFIGLRAGWNCGLRRTVGINSVVVDYVGAKRGIVA